MPSTRLCPSSTAGVPVFVGNLHLRLLYCASDGEDIGSLTGLICCIWLRSHGQIGMSRPDLSHTHFCP